MKQPEAAHLAVSDGEGSGARSLAVLRRGGAGPTIVWLGGFRSDMTATKATALDAFAAERGRACLRFDYSGHGSSGGAFTDGTIGLWLADALAVIGAFADGPCLLVGSSMGGWIALLAAQRLAAADTPPAGLVLLAPAVDFTQALMWEGLDAAARREIADTGVRHRPSAYGPPVPITRRLIEEGRSHLLFGRPIRAHAPVHVIQGLADPDVPWRHAMTLVEHLHEDPAVISLVKDGDHRLSRPEDIALLLRAVEGIAEA